MQVIYFTNSQFSDNKTQVESNSYVKAASTVRVHESFSSSPSLYKTDSTRVNRRSSLGESLLVSAAHEQGKISVSPVLVSLSDGAKREVHIGCAEVLTHEQSKSLSIRVTPPSPGVPNASMVSRPMIIQRKKRSYGFTLKTIRVYIGETSDYRMHHIIEVITINQGDVC